MINKLSRFKLHNNSFIDIKFKKINNYFNLKSFATTNISPAKNYEKLKAELNFETDEDKDFKYEDQLFFLEREMNKLIKEKIEFGQDYATSDLPEYQQREVNSLVEIVKQFDLTEREYFFFTLKNYLEKNCDSRLSKQNSFLRKKNIVLIVDSTAFNPNNEKLDEILKPLIPYLAGELFIGGGSGGSGQETKKEAVKEEKKEEKPKEVFYIFFYIKFLIFLEN